MASAAARWGRRAAAIARPRSELLFVIALTAFAAFLRIWHLSTFPDGFHNDEGNVILDAQRIAREGWIGAWSLNAAGYPIAVNYWVAPFVKVMGLGVLTVRLPMALLGIATIPVAYYAYRVAAGWRVAVCGSVLLTVSLWHLHLSRVGFPAIGWPLAEVAALLLLHLGIRTRRWPYFVGSGLAAGVSTWIYNSATMFVLAMGAYVALWLAWRAWQERRRLRLGFARDAGLMLILGASVLLGAWPLIETARDPAMHYRERFQGTYAFQQERRERCAPVPPEQRDQACKDALTDGFGERAGVVWRKVKELYRNLTTQPKPDGADALGIEPPLGEIVMYLALAGAAVALFKVRSPATDIGLIVVPLLFVATALTIDGQYRRTFGILPFMTLYAGITLGYAWEWAGRQHRAVAAAVAALIALAVGLQARQHLDFYVNDFPHDNAMRFVFFPELRDASEYMDGLGHPYVYWYGDRASLGHETRRALAPDIAGGEDRSTEFSPERDAGAPLPRYDLKPGALPSFPAKRAPQGAVFVFTGRYTLDGHLEAAIKRYPGGEVSGEYDDRYQIWSFRAYYLPPDLLDSYARRDSVTFSIAPVPP